MLNLRKEVELQHMQLALTQEQSQLGKCGYFFQGDSPVTHQETQAQSHRK